MIVAVANRQNVLDIALQEYGNAMAVFDLAFNNDLGITNEIATGGTLKIIASDYVDNDILNFYKTRAIKPATYGSSEIESETTPKGIGYMKITSITNKFIIG